MKRKLKQICLLLLCGLMIFGAFSITAPENKVEARTIFEVESELKEYKNMLAQLQSELSGISGNIAQIEGESGQTMALMEQYQAEIDALEAEIDINTAIMDSYDLKRAEVLTEMAVIQEDYEYRVSMYKKLMQYIYENEYLQYVQEEYYIENFVNDKDDKKSKLESLLNSSTRDFQLLFSSGSISEYLTRRDNFNDIMNAAENLIKEMQVSISDLKALDAELAETQSKYSEYVSELDRKQREMATKQKEFQTIADELNLDADALRQQYTGKNAKVAEIKAKIAELEEERKELFKANATFLWPTQSFVAVTSPFGWRTDPINGSTAYHNGIDIAAYRGTPIYAVADGVVTRADWYSGYGNCVIIYHGDNISTLYGHCDNAYGGRPAFEVSKGDVVKAGDVIAYVGTTGRSTGYHLHFSVINNDNYIDPKPLLPKLY